MKLVPGQSVVLFSDAEEAFKGDDDEGDLAARLFDDQAFDLADVMASRVVDRRALTRSLSI